MDKTHDSQKYEKDIYQLWEDSDAFKESSSSKKYTILMPPPNANASLHAGHAMYTADDILVRWKRMQGYSALWIPGMDHAGFETQTVYEKHLVKEGKSRMDFDRETLYKNIFKFVKENSGLIYEQFKQLGFSADWQRSVFTLDKNVIKTVYETFTKMEKEGYVYRDNYIVNFCVHDGTSLAELEVKHVERFDPLYFIKYKLVNKDKHICVATVRPETIFVDTHLAVNPKDKKNEKLVGQKVENPITGKIMEIISDDFVDPDFGTGIVKLTPAHDANDYAAAKKHNLPIIACIDSFGKIKENGGKYAGLKVKIAREMAVKDLKAKGLIEKIDDKYNHNVMTCYKCGHDLEPLIFPNWFIHVEKLKAKVKEVVEKDKVKFHPLKFKHHMLAWLDIMHDWPISRQIVWGIRIPVWYNTDKSPNLQVSFIDKSGNKKFGNLKDFDFDEVEKGLQNVIAPSNSVYVISDTKPQGNFLPETDTFDTWFSSSQWPIVTLKESEFSTRFPTDTMGTLSDILKFWVSRMILFSLYLKSEIPFKDVYLWSMVADSKGIKMSKSKGNVINPIDLVEKYGADALRMSLMYGTPAGSKVILAEDKVKGMRNFANKIWNAARYLTLSPAEEVAFHPELVVKKFSGVNISPKSIENAKKLATQRLQKDVQLITKYLEKFQIDKASETVYSEFWHWFCDELIEDCKNNKIEKSFLKEEVFPTFLKLLHPFMPFITEAIYQQTFAKNKNDLLIISSWPK